MFREFRVWRPFCTADLTPSHHSEEKLKLHKFADYMPEYTGDNSFNAVVASYLLNHFTKLYRSHERVSRFHSRTHTPADGIFPPQELFHHLTCATGNTSSSLSRHTY